MTLPIPIPIIIVSYRNANDVLECVSALSLLADDPPFEIYICANGGAKACDNLISALAAPDGPCEHDSVTPPYENAPQFVRICRLHLRNRGTRVELAEARENLGYAGGINAWLRVLLAGPRWPGVWILNPDTRPDQRALAELVAWSKARKKGMVGSRVVDRAQPDIVQTRGLRWRRFRASTQGVDKWASSGVDPDPDAIEARLDSPSGVSIYVTRRCLQRIGLMDERYFLYFEDLEWGSRAKSYCGIGYAHKSVVVHKGGTTIGSGTSRATASELAVYLEFRNRIMFVRQHHPRWVAWTMVILFFRCFEYALAGALRNMCAALRGYRAGIAGETGRPDDLFDFGAGIPRWRSKSRSPHRVSLLQLLVFTDAGVASKPKSTKRRLKLAISLGYYIIIRALDSLRRISGRPIPERLVVIYYHSIPTKFRANFARQLDLLSTFVRVVSADYFTPVQRVGHSVAITFDDALTDVLENAIPELTVRGMPATIFVPVGVIGCPINWEVEQPEQRAAVVASTEALRQLNSHQIRLGCHSVTHPYLSRIPRDRAYWEITEARKQMRQLFDTEAQLFAFPYGDHDDATVDFCRSAGYTWVFTNVPSVIDPRSDQFIRGRVLVEADDGLLEFYLKMFGAFGWMGPVSKLKARLRGAPPAERPATGQSPTAENAAS